MLKATPLMSMDLKCERCDDIPLIWHGIKQMEIERIIDASCPAPHGNWQGLSYGQLSLILLCYIITQSDHRLCAVEPWIEQHRHTLEKCSGWTIRPEDGSDDRLAIVVEHLGTDVECWETIETALGQHLIGAYQLSTEVARVDSTSFSVYHQVGVDGTVEEALIRYGYSKDHRPDLAQYRYMLGTLDPLGLPLVTQVLAGNGSDDSMYVESWERFKRVVGHPDFVFVGDSKASALATRAQIHQRGGLYCMPLSQTGHAPLMLKQWVLHPPTPVEFIRLSHQDEDDPPIGIGFEMRLGKCWPSFDEAEQVTWEERYLVVHSYAVAQKELARFETRLAKVETGLAQLAAKPVADRCEVEQKAKALLKRHRLSDCFEIEMRPSRLTTRASVGQDCSSSANAKSLPSSFLLHFAPLPEHIQQKKLLMGWRIYLTNASSEQLSLTQAIEHYRGQWQPERGFHRHKRGQLPALPIYFRNPDRIRGIMLVLSIALRLFCLLEYQVRRTLDETGSALAGLYDGNPRRTTKRPTTEALLKAFGNITLYQLPDGSESITPLNPLQKTILKLMNVPEHIYELG